jgi:hypothetical protein
MLALHGATVDASSSPPITYADGKVSADFQGVPLKEAIAALEQVTGVEFHGEPRDAHDVTMRFERVSFRDVLDRLFGDQNFTITYDARGAPRRVYLLSSAPPAAAVPRRRPAMEGLAGLVGRYPAVELPPILAKALGMPRARLPQVLAAGLSHQDQNVCAAAASLFVQQIDSDPKLHDALMSTEDRRLINLLRSWAGPGLPRLIGAFAAESRDPLLRNRSRRLQESLARGKPST